MRAALTFLSFVVGPLLLGCTSVVAADFDVVATPTECSLLAPQTANRRSFVRCDAASTCVATDNGKASCAAIAVAGEEGAACAAQTECAPGLTCSTQLGCLRVCSVGDPCADGTACNPFSADAPLTAGGHEYGYCAPASCDPLHPLHPQGDRLAACANDECHFIGPSQSACFVAFEGQKRFGAGAACRDDRDCSTANSCYAGRCTTLCRVGGDDCAEGRSCVEGASDVGTPLLEGETYGHCE